MPSTLQVFPIKDYGAIAQGSHRRKLGYIVKSQTLAGASATPCVMADWLPQAGLGTRRVCAPDANEARWMRPSTTS